MATSPDLGVVDELCRLVLSAQRLGCTVQLSEVPAELHALLELAGVADIVIEEQRTTKNAEDLP